MRPQGPWHKEEEGVVLGEVEWQTSICPAMLLSPIYIHIHNTPNMNAHTLLHSLRHTPAHDFMQHVHFFTTPSSQQYTCAPAHSCTQTQPHLYTLTQPSTCSSQPTLSSTPVHLHAFTYTPHTFTHIYTHTHVYTHTSIHSHIPGVLCRFC